jgi:hypothetical protein
MPSIDRRADLLEAAQEELERAASLSWRELASCTPWGDTFEGFTPAGRSACFERNYLWVGDIGGPILIEVVVYQREAHEQGVRLVRSVAP